MKALAPTLLLALALAGCGDVTPAKGDNGIHVANPDSDRLKGMSPLNQRLALMHAIRDTGNRCHRVVTGAYQQYYRGMEMWVALCEEGTHWAIFIAANSDIQVRDCAQAEQLSLPLCRPVAPMPPDPNDPGARESGNAVGNATANRSGNAR